MITIALELDDCESPVWNLMWLMYVPCEKHIASLGSEMEVAEEQFNFYAKNVHDSQSVVSAGIYQNLMDRMDKTKKALKPYIVEWMLARHGIGLN